HASYAVSYTCVSRSCRLRASVRFPSVRVVLFFFNDTATTEIYTLSLHDALPILDHRVLRVDPAAELGHHLAVHGDPALRDQVLGDRKSTRLNSSHQIISYAVFCLKKKKQREAQTTQSINGSTPKQHDSGRATPRQ